jgi:hypothetical protein
MPTPSTPRKPITAREARRYGLRELAGKIASGNRPAPVKGTDVRDIFPDPAVLHHFMRIGRSLEA